MTPTLVFQPCLLVISAVVSLGPGAASPAHERQPRSAPCPSCSHDSPTLNLSDDEVKKLRLAMIKAQILEKLRMAGPPNTTLHRQSLPKPLVEGRVLKADQETVVADFGSNMDEFYAKTTEVVKFPYRSVQTCPFQSKSGACIHFDLSDLHDSDVKAAELWVHKQKDPADATAQTFYVSRVSMHTGVAQHRDIRPYSTSINTGWVSVDVRHAVRQWLRHKSRNHHFHLWCATCRRPVSNAPISQAADHQPFLVIHKRTGYRRQRRAIDCVSGTTACCRQRFYVSFKELGWEDWVLQPTGYWANFCRGSCQGLWQPMLRYTAMVSTLVTRSQGSRVPGLTPCCAPNKMSSVSMLYVDPSAQIIKKDVPNMTVESCGCA